MLQDHLTGDGKNDFYSDVCDRSLIIIDNQLFLCYPPGFPCLYMQSGSKGTGFHTSLPTFHEIFFQPYPQWLTAYSLSMNTVTSTKLVGRWALIWDECSLHPFPIQHCLCILLATFPPPMRLPLLHPHPPLNPLPVHPRALRLPCIGMLLRKNAGTEGDKLAQSRHNSG